MPLATRMRIATQARSMSSRCTSSRSRLVRASQLFADASCLRRSLLGFTVAARLPLGPLVDEAPSRRRREPRRAPSLRAREGRLRRPASRQRGTRRASAENSFACRRSRRTGSARRRTRRRTEAARRTASVRASERSGDWASRSSAGAVSGVAGPIRSKVALRQSPGHVLEQIEVHLRREEVAGEAEHRARQVGDLRSGNSPIGRCGEVLVVARVRYEMRRWS